MNSSEFFTYVENAHDRTIRFYCCAVATEIKDLAKTNEVMKAVAYGELMAERHMLEPKEAILAIKLREYMQNVARNTTNFQRRIAREAGIICLKPTIEHRDVRDLRNSIIQFKGHRFDDEINKCIRLNHARKSGGTKHLHIRDMARKMRDEQDWAVGGVLADACEELDILTQDAWDHLRQDCHWRGCWVLDDLFGVW